MISFLSKTNRLSNHFHHKFHQFFLIELSFVDVFEAKKNPIIFTAAYLLYLFLENEITKISYKRIEENSIA